MHADFDAGYYLAHNPDVAAARVDPLQHYLTIGWKEGRNPSAFFDTRYYLTQNPDVAAAGVNPLAHYEQIGWTEGRDPSAAFSTRQYLLGNPDIAAAHIDPLAEFLAEGQAQGRLPRYDADFDRSYYLSHNPDIAAAGVDPFMHYVTIGWKEGRDPSAFFNTRFYLAQNPDVAAAGVVPLFHYEQSGWKEGRDPSAGFSTRQYLLANPDIAATHMDPLAEFIATGQAEGRLPRYDGDFDRAYYLSHNPDVAAAGVDPFAHYVTIGWKEGRDPNAFFNTRYYLAQNPDVAAAGVDPLLHYEQSGWKEGRNPSALFNTKAYLAQNPDVAAARIDPLTHYLAFGRNEGRGTGTTPGTAPTADLATAFRLGAAGAHVAGAPVVELVGSADPGSTVQLLGTSLSAVADTAGQYRLAGVALAPGHNLLNLSATDPAGRIGLTTVDISRTAATSGSVVTDWDQAVISAIKAIGSDPQFASRAMAIESIAVLDVVNAIQGKPGFLVSLAAPTGLSETAAIAQAAHDVLVYLYPTRAGVFDTQLAQSLSTLPYGTPTAASLAFGKSVAAAVIAIRDRDGWNRIVTDDGSTDPGKWRPTAPDFMLAQDPQWASVTPFTLTSDSEFRAAAPPAIGSAEYLAGLAYLQAIGKSNSTLRTADQTQIARFWADGAGTETPPGHWNDIARQVITAMNLDAATAARVMAEVDVAMADSAFAGWDTKFFYDEERPITAIRTGDVGNVADPSWSPLIKTPPHPSYVSGHSTFSAAASTVLASIFGSSFAFSTTDDTLPGVIRSFASFDAAAQEAAISRVYGGIHFTWDSTAGLTMGTKIGQTAISAFENGNDAAPMLLLDQSGAISTAGPATLSGYALDSTAPLTGILATLDGGTPVLVAVDAAGRFSFTTDIFGTVASGTHNLTLSATDSTGHTTVIPVPFTRGAGGLSLSLTSPGNGGVIAAGAHLTGQVASTAAAVTSLTYAFDGGVAAPVLRGTDGSFDIALDLSKLAAGAHTLTVRATDASGGEAVVTATETLQAPVPLTVVSLTPLNGTGEIGVTYRPEVTFSRAVDVTTLTPASFYATDPSGAVLAATIIPRADGTGASLFFTNPMPGAATVTLHVVGSLIRAAGDGATLDAAASGVSGSTRTSTLSTVSTATVPGTTLIGVIADPGPDLQPLDADDVRNNSDGTKTYLLPIAGAKVYILGHESEAVYTDAQGRFTLTNVPTGSVKVAVDGRTATNAPANVFFPEMVMDVQVTPGIVNTVPGGMGTTEEMAAHKATLGVYLPRVQTSILTTVSATAPTVVTVPVEAAGLLSDAQRSMLSLTIQPGSVVGADGQAVQGAKVGISPVPADLVKDMLPAGLLQHSFDITIQAPGGAAFTTPAQLTLPNVFGLAAGDKTYFLSFDHTTGKLVIDGTATVSADGLTVTTDPGAGVTKPGWHGMTPPGSLSDGPGSDAEEDFSGDPPMSGPECFAKAVKASTLNIIKNGLDCAKEVAGKIKKLLDIAKGLADLTDNLIQLESNVKNLQLARENHQDAAALASRAAVINNTCAAFAADFNLFKDLFKVESSEIDIALTCAAAAADTANAVMGNAYSNGCISLLTSVAIGGELNGLSTSLKLLIDAKNLVEGKLTNFAITTTCDIIAHIANQLAAVQQPAPGADPLPGAISLLSLDSTVERSSPTLAPSGVTEDIDALFTSLDASITSDLATAGSISRSYTAIAVPPQSQLDSLGKNVALLERALLGPPKDMFYEIKVAGQVYRGITDGAGKLNFFFPASTAFTVSFYSPVLDIYAQYSGTSAQSGEKTVIPNPVFLSIADLPPATGPGGLPDLIEEIVGGSLTRADSLVPGVQDKVAVHLGVAATRSLLNTTGIIAAAPLQGTANQVVIAGSLMDSAGQYAYVATGAYGLAILDVSNPLKPALLSETALPGNAVDVAVDAGLGVAAVADGAGGLVLLNVGMLTAPKVIATVALDARAVLTYEGVAYTTNGGSVVAVDMATGAILQRLVVAGSGTLTGLTRDGSTLWTIDAAGQLTGIAAGTGTLIQAGSVATGLTQAQSSRLYAAAGVVYVPDAIAGGAGSNGYSTVAVGDAAHPAMLGRTITASASADAIALNGAGQGVGIGNPLGRGARLDVIDTTDPTVTGRLLTEFALPAQAFGVAIGDGVAFVADGTAGLQVVNYKAIDTSGAGPTITVLTGPGGSAAGTGAVTLAEGSIAGFTVQLSDPGQIRNAELLLNGVAVVNDSSYPFELTGALPSIAANGSGTVTLAVRATDTAGHVATTAPVTVTLTPDRVAPQLLGQSLAANSVHAGSFRSFSYRFSKPIDPASLTASAFTLIGPSGTVVAPSSIQARASGLLVEVTYASLPAGSYTAGLAGAGILDRAGNALGGSVATAFTIASGNYSAGWSSQVTGVWSDALNWDGGKVPGATDTVLLQTVPGTSAIHANGSDTVAAIGLLGGVLDITGGVLTVNGVIDDQAGSTLILEGGVLSKATVQGPGTTLLKSGSLDGVTLAGAVTATGSIQATNGLTLSGTVNASEFNLYGALGQVLNTGTINFAPSANYLYSREFDSIGPSYQGTFTNRGSITASGTFMMLSLNNLANSGSVSLANGVNLTLGSLVSNTGTLALGDRSTLTLSGTTSLAALGTVSGTNDTLVLSGTLDLTGRTLGTAALPEFTGISLQGATLLGGTIVQDASIALQANPYLTNGGTFDGTSWTNGLKITGGTYTIRNGITVQGGIDLHAGFSGYANLVFQGSQTLTGVPITMGGSSGNTAYSASITTDPGGSLTLGAGTSIAVDTGTASLGGYGSSIVNSGAISIASTARLVVRKGSFTNQGTVNFASGGILQLDGVTALTDVSGLTGLTGTNGILSINSVASTLDLQGGTLSTSILPGAIGDVEFYYASLSNGTLRSGPATAVKTLTLSNVTMDGTFTDAGTLNLTRGFATHGLVLNMVSDSAYSSAYLNATAAQTLDHTTITVGQTAGGNNAAIRGPLTLAADSSLTIGSGSTASLSGAIVNAGTIAASGTRLSTDGDSFGNAGTLTSAGGQVTVGSTSFSNGGSVAIGALGTLTVQSTTLANSGTIDLADTANLVVTKATTLTGLGTVTGSGTTTLYGKLDLGGGTLDLGGLSGALKLQGGVTNGTIREGTKAIAFTSGVVLDHAAVLAADGSSVSTGSLVAMGAASANPDGSITFGPDGSTVFLAGPGAVVSPTGFSTIIGAGHDTFKLSSISTSDYYNTAATILNFSQTGGDVLDLSAIMAASTWDRSAATLGNYLSFSQSGNDTIVSGNPLGTYSYNSGTIAVLKNTSGITLASLEANNAVKV